MKHTSAVLLALLAMAFVVRPAVAGDGDGTSFDPEGDYDRTAWRGAPKGGGDKFPEVDDPALTTVAEADPVLGPRDWIIGVALDGRAQAFPVLAMGRPEIVNISCGRAAITVTW